jgi:uncharacterized protein YdhG (YjbR/CyaY superfamily)
MAKTDFKSVDEYIATHPQDMQVALRRVRGAIRKAIPDAEEGISYQIPTYKRSGAYVVYFAGWKEHYSLYPASARLIAHFADDFMACRIEKSTIRFTLAEPVPVRLIGRIAKFMAGEAATRAEAKRARSRSGHGR